MGVEAVGGGLPDTVVVFGGESAEKNHLRAFSLTSFIYRHHPVCLAVCLSAGAESERLSDCFDLQAVWTDPR